VDTLLSIDAEYIAMIVAAQKVAWLKILLEEIGKKIIPIVVMDNEDVKKLTKTPIFY
jgi:hypothetical protein